MNDAPSNDDALADVPRERWTGFLERLGCDRLRAGDGRGEVTLPLDATHTNLRGVAHGGVIASLLDTALGAAVVSAIRREEWCGTVQLDVQFLLPAVGSRLTARGEVVRRARRLAFARGEVRDESGHVVATATGTWYVWPARPGTPRR